MKEEVLSLNQKKKINVSRKKRCKIPVAAVSSTLGTIILIILVLLCIPITVPKVFGFQVYSVITGSMEPSIPVGSLVYVKSVAQEKVEKGDVIGFFAAKDSSAIIIHRVISNSPIMGEFITKGDANKAKDMNPVTYDDYIGKVVLSVPKAGALVQIFTSASGRIGAGCMVGIGILLHFIHLVLPAE